VSALHPSRRQLIEGTGMLMVGFAIGGTTFAADAKAVSGLPVTIGGELDVGVDQQNVWAAPARVKKLGKY